MIFKLSYHKAAEFSTENGSLEELKNHANKDGTLLEYLLLHTQRHWADMGEGVLEEGKEEKSSHTKWQIILLNFIFFTSKFKI